ncbi:MAG: spinster family MFS transporter [Desulfitobacteriaceae bacterium]
MAKYRVLLLLLVINIFNYIDRNALAGVSPLIKTAFHLSDGAMGALGSVFLLSYTLVAVPFGVWSDLWKPQKVAAVGVAIWSLASVLTSTALTQGPLFLWRSLVGVGEAAYVATAGTIISKRYDPDKRSKMLGVFNLGLPLGAALGVVLGGVIGERYGWPTVFVVVGAPGFILAVMAWLIRDINGVKQKDSIERSTGRNIDQVMEKNIETNIEKRIIQGELGSERLSNKRFDGKKLLSTLKALKAPYWLTVIGYIGISYCFGAVINWLPMYMTRIMHYSLGEAATLSGAIIVLAGLLGAPSGGWLGDRWFVRHQGGRGYTLFWGCLASAIFMWLGIGFNSTILFGLSAFFMLWHVGVAAAMVFDTTHETIWNTATAIAMLFMHLLGDVPSSMITGIISDNYGLVAAFNLLPVAMLIGGIAFGLSGYLQGTDKLNFKAIGA